MRVLVQARPDLFALRGGDSVHVPKTVAALRRLGVQVDLSTELRPDVSGHELVHVFNLMRVDEASIQADNARHQRKPYVVTPLYWNIEETAVAGGPADRGWLQRWPGEQRIRRRVLARAEAVIVSGAAEREEIDRDFGVSDRCHVVPVGADGVGVAGAGLFRERYGLRDFVLCVARIGPHKNQFRVMEAARGLDFPMVFIGPVYDPGYYERCRRAARDRVSFLGSGDPETVASAYAAARVHILASWREIPGLSTLEAALGGCNVVTTRYGTAGDYLGDDAWYCHPGDVSAIREALLAACDAPRTGRATGRVEAFTWDRAAAETAAIYRVMLGRDG